MGSSGRWLGCQMASGMYWMGAGVGLGGGEREGTGWGICRQGARNERWKHGERWAVARLSGG